MDRATYIKASRRLTAYARHLRSVGSVPSRVHHYLNAAAELRLLAVHGV